MILCFSHIKSLFGAFRNDTSDAIIQWKQMFLDPSGTFPVSI